MSNRMEHSLDDELQAIEIQLAHLAPSSVSSDMLGRMEQLMGQWGDPQLESDRQSSPIHFADGDLTELEVHLDRLSPAAVSDGMLDRMSQAMDRWHEDVSDEVNVVPFNENRQRHQSTRRFFGGGMLSAAAAVAVLGVVTAFVYPHLTSPQSSSIAQVESATPQHLSNTVISSSHSDTSVVQNAWVTSEALSHKVTSTRDRGVIFSDDNIPHRCIRIDYIDKIKVIDKEGREIEIKTPGVNYMLIPVETN